jgi:hypothetical protein
MWPRSRRTDLVRSIGNPLRPFDWRRRICLIEEFFGNWLDAFVRTIQIFPGGRLPTICFIYQKHFMVLILTSNETEAGNQLRQVQHHRTARR